MNGAEAAFGPDFPIDARDHVQGSHIRDLIRRDETGPDGGREILSLCRTEPAGHFLKLNVYRAHAGQE